MIVFADKTFMDDSVPELVLFLNFQPEISTSSQPELYSSIKSSLALFPLICTALIFTELSALQSSLAKIKSATKSSTNGV